jgi:hypothetical protein
LLRDRLTSLKNRLHSRCEFVASRSREFESEFQSCGALSIGVPAVLAFSGWTGCGQSSCRLLGCAPKSFDA